MKSTLTAQAMSRIAIAAQMPSLPRAGWLGRTAPKPPASGSYAMDAEITAHNAKVEAKRRAKLAARAQRQQENK